MSRPSPTAAQLLAMTEEEAANLGDSVWRAWCVVHSPPKPPPDEAFE